MKRTRWTFAAAMMVLVVGVTRPHSEPVTDAGPDRTLDFTGIERLRVETDGNLDIEIGGGAPGLSILGPKDVDVAVERRGDTLHVTTSHDGDGHFGGTLTVPARLQHLDIHGSRVDIEAIRPVTHLRITTTDALSWDGDADRLEVVRRHEHHEAVADAGAGADAAADAAAAAASGDDCACDGVVDIDGTIDELFVTADVGKVYIDRAGGHGHATLDLADGVTFDLENALDLEGVTIVRRPATKPGAGK